MGIRHSRLSDKTGGWKKTNGCKHHSVDTKVIKMKWKQVPMTGEETKMVLRRMMTMADKTAVEGVTGLKKTKSITTHDCVEVCIKLY